MSIAGTGGNGQYGAIRVDTTGITLSGDITLTADSGIQTNTGGITGTVISGVISGGFGFTRFATGSGAGTLAFQNASTYSGMTTLGRSGTFAGGVTILDFSAASAPAEDILYHEVITPGALNLIGGNNSATVLSLIGKAGTVNQQRFGNVTLNTASTGAGGTAVISLSSGSGGQMNLSLGSITRSSSAASLAFQAPANGSITTTQADGFLGPWATYRQASGDMRWAQVTSGVIGAFSSDLLHETGQTISANTGYSSASHLEVSGSSTGAVTLASGTTQLASLTLSDSCSERVIDLGGQTLRLGSSEVTSTGGVLMTSNSRNVTLGVAGSAGILTAGSTTAGSAGQLFLTNASSGILTVNSAIANNGSGVVSLFINGASGSKVILAGSNSYTGGTQVLSGVVELKTASALGTTGTITVMEGAAIQLGGGITLNRALTAGGNGEGNTGVIRNVAGDNSWTAAITAVAPVRFHSDAGTLTLTHASGSASNIISGTHAVTFSGNGNIAIGSRLNTSSGTVTKEGNGTLVMSGNGGTSLTGATTINGGVLRMTSGNALGSSSLITVNDVATGAALELSGGISVANAITFNGSGINGGTNLNGTGAIRNLSGSNTLSGTLGIGLDAAGPRISADAGTTLTLSGTLRSAATLAGTRIGLLGGGGTIHITGVITNGTTAATYITGIAKVESGTVNLRTAATFTPNTTTPTTSLLHVRGGTLNLDFANASATSQLIPGTNILTVGGGTLTQGGNTLGGGTLLLSGKAGTAHSQSLAGMVMAGGRSAITAVSEAGGSMKLALGPISRGTGSGSSLNLTLPANGSITTTTLNTNGILNGGLTVGNTTWATSAATTQTGVSWANTGDVIQLGGFSNGQQVSFTGTAPAGLTAGIGYYVVNAGVSSFQVAATPGGTPMALTNDGSTATFNLEGAITGLPAGSYSSSFAADANVDVPGGSNSTPGAISVHSLRFNAPEDTTLNLSGTLTNTSGGLLITPNVTGNVTIQSNTSTARTWSSSTGADFTIHHHGSGTLTLASTLTLTNATAFTKAGPGTLTFAGSTASSGVQVRVTEGLMNISGSNRFTSTTDPTLFLGSATSSAKVSFGNGASTGAETWAAIYVLGAGSSLVGSGSALYTLGLQNSGTLDFRSLTLGGAGLNEDNLSLEAYSGGTLLMGAANTYVGRTNIGRATLVASVIADSGVASSLGTGSSAPDIVMNDTNSTSATVSTLRYIGSADTSTNRAVRLFTDGQSMPSLTAVIENNGTGSLKFTTPFSVEGNTTLARTFRLAGTHQGANEMVSIGQTATSTVSLDKSGTGTWTLTGNSTYTGGTTVSNGTLQLGNGGSAGMVGGGDIALQSGAVLVVKRQDAHTLANTITGSGSLRILNPVGGVTTLSSSGNSFFGGTAVASGTLLVSNPLGSATGSGNVAVAAGATLGGDGRIAPAAGAGLDICGTLSVGMEAATAADLEIVISGSGSLILNHTSTLSFDLLSGAGLGNNTTQAASSDLLRIGGTLQIQPGSMLKVSGNGLTGYAAGDEWRLIDWSTLSGSTSDTFTTMDLPELTPGLVWNTSQLYSLGTISVIVVPEPGRFLLGLAGLTLILMRRRRIKPPQG